MKKLIHGLTKYILKRDQYLALNSIQAETLAKHAVKYMVNKKLIKNSKIKE
jgi:hypothetical protein